MTALRYGIVGGGFISAFQLKALRQVRGVEVAGLMSRRPPEALAAYVREHGAGRRQDLRQSIKEMAPHVDVIAIFAPNFSRVEMVEEIVDAVKAGAKLAGVICEKPLARNLAEARRVVKLVEDAKLPHAYFENQLHMKSMAGASGTVGADHAGHGTAHPARSGEEHAGPHNPWFWDPVRQGGGVMSDMGCHCLAVVW